MQTTITLSPMLAFRLAEEFAAVIYTKAIETRLLRGGYLHYASRSAFSEVQAAIRSLSGRERAEFIGNLRHLLAGKFKDNHTPRTWEEREEQRAETRRAMARMVNEVAA